MKILAIFTVLCGCVCLVAQDKVIFDLQKIHDNPKELLTSVEQNIKEGKHTFENYVYSASSLIELRKFEEAVGACEKGLGYVSEKKHKAVLYAVQAIAFSMWAKNDEKSATNNYKKALLKIKRAVAYDASNMYFAQMYHLYAILAKDKLEEHLALKKIKQVDPNAAGQEVFLTVGGVAVVIFIGGVLAGMYIQGDDKTEDKVLKVIESVLISTAHDVVKIPLIKFMRK
ncbi:hypothetical protein [Candidatus Uabimicrobium amorphum]|uniref:Tetratricopeptide repeat-like domain-containing protein n=1 Tax=Uabimicrobium amorphum TaxID=2596890 RepID=A0A5S9F620_UABAM|nr:hypothetical protein [Candidatus Uabimicrobium amorphum]BBM87218.1 hypothetical protein UABAM_05621 [Candidatus Uabimicrobium amorphum]